MSDKKFNLKTYQKINGNEHIDMRLRDAHEKAPDVINEKQLESYRATEANVAIEKLLEDKRTGEETEITEKRLDTHKSKFANKYRNPDAHAGDINKLEEQRLLNDPSEKEKYEAASSAPKEFRWWENTKSSDDLKLAKDTKKPITSQKKDEKFEELTFDNPRWQEVDEPSEEKAEIEPRVMTGVPEEFPVTEVNKADEIGKDTSDNLDDFFLMTEKFLQPNPQKPYISGIYMVLGFDPAPFEGDENKIRKAALAKVIMLHPELSGLINKTDFFDIQESGDDGIIKLRAQGEQFAPIVEKYNNKPSVPSVESEKEPIEEVNFETKDIEGTPMAIGLVRVNTPVTADNEKVIIESIIEFIHNKHPEVEVNESSLDMANIVNGEVGYMVGLNNTDIATDLPVGLPTEASTDFDIVVAATDAKKNSINAK